MFMRGNRVKVPDGHATVRGNSSQNTCVFPMPKDLAKDGI